MSKRPRREQTIGNVFKDSGTHCLVSLFPGGPRLWVPAHLTDPQRINLKESRHGWANAKCDNFQDIGLAVVREAYPGRNVMATPGSSHQDKGVDIKVGNLWEALVEPGKEVQPLDAIAQVKHYMNTRSAIRDGIKDYEQVIQKFATSTYILLIPNRPEVADLTAWDKFVAGSRITYPGVRFELWGEVEVYSRLRAVAFSQFSTFLAFLDPASVAFNATFKALHTEVMHLGSPLTQLLQASTKTFFDKQIAHASRSGYSSFVLDPKLPPADRDLLHRTVRRLCQIVNNAQHRM